jgi:polyhydroxyalkanoate synthase subunit PhaC
METAPPPKKTAEENAETLRRIAADHLSAMLGGWMNFAPETDRGAEKMTGTAHAAPSSAESFLENWQDWLNPFKADHSPTAIDPDAAREFLAGLDAYRKHPAAREKSRPAAVIWRQGTTVLRDYAPEAAAQPAVLIVPSLINRYDIFDLAPHHSFLRFLTEQGLRPLVMDWDSPGEEEKNFTLTDYMAKRLIPALGFLAPRVPQGRAHIVGYCMGGLLALALALFKRESAASLTLMATPWNFAAAGAPPAAMRGERDFSALAEQTEPYLANCGWLPPEALRAFFASFQPGQVVDKFARFSGVDPASTEAERFVLSEDWLNDGVPLAAPVARECLREWYGENRPGRIMWRVAGELVDPRLLECATCIVAPGKDYLVPPESSKPLVRFIRGAVLHEPMLGHIGLLASHAAPQEVWTPLAGWLKRQ